MNLQNPLAAIRRHAFAAAVAAALLVLAGCGASSASAPPAAPPAAEVTVAEVAHKPLRDWAEFTGRLEAVESVQIHPRVSGVIDKVGFTEGARVRKGQLLFRIDPRPFVAETDKAAAARTRAVSQLALAKANHGRAQRLIDENAIAREEFEKLSTDESSASSDLAAANASLDAARLNLEFTEVRAPIDGRVSRALITAGNLVGTDSLLTTVVSDNPVYAYFDADEQTYLQYGRAVRANPEHSNPVYLGLADESGYPHTGELNFVDNQVDPRSGTIRGRAVFANPDGAFTPGLFARIKLVGREAHETVLIDDRAVGTDLGKKFVLVLKADNTVDYRGVTLGPQVDGLRIVRDGLQPGEVIVVNGLQRVRPGAKVTPTKVAMDVDGVSLRQAAASAPVPVAIAGSVRSTALDRP